MLANTQKKEINKIKCNICDKEYNKSAENYHNNSYYHIKAYDKNGNNNLRDKIKCILGKYINQQYKDNEPDGYLYCLYNEVYEHYGKNVYKLGCTNNLDKRIVQYCTSYLEPSRYIITSSKLPYVFLAESILFSLLDTYRLTNKREFFKCDETIIKKELDKTIVHINNIKNIDTITDKELNDLLNISFIYDKINPVSFNKTSIIIQNILNASEISTNKYKTLTTSKSINESDLNAIKKYELKRRWNIKDSDEKTLIKCLKNETTLNSLNFILDKEHNKLYLHDKIDQQKNVILNIIKTLGFNLNNLECKMNKDEFYNNVKQLLSANNDFGGKYNEIRMLFGKRNAELKQDMKGLAFFSMINSFLEDFGIRIINKRKSIKIIKNGIIKDGKEDRYYLTILEDYLKFIK